MAEEREGRLLAEKWNWRQAKNQRPELSGHAEKGDIRRDTTRKGNNESYDTKRYKRAQDSASDAGHAPRW